MAAAIPAFILIGLLVLKMTNIVNEDGHIQYFKNIEEKSPSSNKKNIDLPNNVNVIIQQSPPIQTKLKENTNYIIDPITNTKSIYLYENDSVKVSIKSEYDSIIATYKILNVKKIEASK